MSHHSHMRITLNLDDDVLTTARRYAKSRSISLGKAVSDLVRRGIAAPRPTRMVNGLVVLDLPSNSPEVTMETVKRLETGDHFALSGGNALISGHARGLERAHRKRSRNSS